MLVEVRCPACKQLLMLAENPIKAIIKCRRTGCKKYVLVEDALKPTIVTDWRKEHGHSRNDRELSS